MAGWLLGVTANALDMIAPEVPWSAPVGVILVTALVSALAYSTYQRIQVRRERVEPNRAVAFLVLGKASALAGAVGVGGDLADALLFFHRVGAGAPRGRGVKAAVTVVAGAAVCGVGLLLERACRVPRQDDDDQPGTDTPG